MIRSFVLDPPSCNIPANPGSDVLVNFDHYEEDDAVDDDHAEEDAEIHPFGPMHVNLEDVLEDVLSGDLGEIGGLVVEDQALEIVLVLALQGPEVEAYVGHGVAPERLWDVVGEAEVAGDEHEYPLDSRPDDDAHEEVGDDAGYGHHEALHHSHTRVEAQHEEDVVRHPRVEPHHEVADGAGEEGDQYQKRHCR